MEFVELKVESLDDIICHIGVPSIFHTKSIDFDAEGGKFFLFLLGTHPTTIATVKGMPKGRYIIRDISTNKYKWTDEYNDKDIDESPSRYIRISVINVSEVLLHFGNGEQKLSGD